MASGNGKVVGTRQGLCSSGGGDHNVQVDGAGCSKEGNVRSVQWRDVIRVCCCSGGCIGRVGVGWVVAIGRVGVGVVVVGFGWENLLGEWIEAGDLEDEVGEAISELVVSSVAVWSELA